MTTAAAAAHYLAAHLHQVEDRQPAIYNPHNKTLDALPVIYGFNNGGHSGWYSAALLAQDGTELGGHICSHEGYMPHDLGILEGTRPDRHEKFREHYPDGYRMEFIPSDALDAHEGFQEAVKQHEIRYTLKPQ